MAEIRAAQIYAQILVEDLGNEIRAAQVYAQILVEDPQPPAAPSDLTATAVSPTEIDLTWTDNSDDETGFKIQRAPDDSGSPGTWADLDTAAADAEAYADETCAESTTYWYRVCATNAAGDSAWTTPASDTTPASNTAPGAPTITAPTDGSTVGLVTTVTLTEATDPESDPLTYHGRWRLDAGSWTAFDFAASPIEYEITFPASGTADIEAWANDGTVDGASDSVTVTVAGPPTGPTVTSVTVNYNYATIVASTYSGVGDQGGRRFRVYASDGVTLIWNSDWVTAPIKDYPDIPLSPNTSYKATVQDKDEYGNETAESAQVSFTTLDYPDAQVTQAGLAITTADATPEARATQVLLEPIAQKTGYAEARVTQVLLETILPAAAAAAVPSAPCALLLEVYARDRVTVDWSVTTVPGTDSSFLRDPSQDGSQYAAQECDFAAGRASISSVKVAVIDYAWRGDQQVRWLTEKLADPVTGRGAIMGRRCRLRRFISPARGWVTIADGPAGPPRLRPSYAGYEWEIRDSRENERRLGAFLKATGRTVLPLGTVEDWGALPDGSYLLPAVSPIVGTTSGTDGGYNCIVDFSALWSGGTAPAYLEITEAFTEAATPTPPQGAMDGDPMAGTLTIDIFWRFPNVEVWWRAAGTSDPWNVVNPNERIGNISPLEQWVEPTLVTTQDGDIGTTGRTGACLTQVSLTDLHGGNTVPTSNGQSVEVLFVYAGKPTEKNPLLVEGLTAGQLLKKLYDGDYTPDADGNPTPTGILYNTAALTAMTTPVLLYVTEPADDLREWTEKQVYAPLGYAPTFDNNLRISPLSQVPPTTTAGLVDLTNAITAPNPSWQHGDTVVNVLRFTYRRFYPDTTAAAGFGVREITEEYREPDSIEEMQAEKPLDIDTVAFGAIGTTGGAAVGVETGAMLAKLRHDILFPRYAWGTPTATLKCFRSSTYALRAGSFALAHPTWMPHYPTQQRGMSALVQVLEARDLNCAWREFVVEVVSDADTLPESLQTRSGFIWAGGSGGGTITGTQGA